MLKILDSEEFNAINKIYDDYKENIKELNKLLHENYYLTTLLNEYNDISRRILLISSANSFERHLTKFIPSVFSEKDNSILHNFLSKQALSRKYHTLFKWEQSTTHKNCNTFYSLFGEDFKKEIRNKIEREDDLKKGENDFITLGNERNQITHKGVKFAEYNRDMDSVFELYKSALQYYCFLCDEIKKAYT